MNTKSLHIGFVGLGDQGTPIAERVIAAGWPTSFFARRPEVITHFTARGARFAATLPELGAASDIVAVIVVDDAQVRDVVLGDENHEGVLAGMRAGSMLVIHSTVHPQTCRDIASIANSKNIALLDAPVSGGRKRSYAGELTVMVGGDFETFMRAEPVFAAFGSTVRLMGDIGAGQVTKLINNYFCAAHIATARDALTLIKGLGIDPHAAAEILPTGAGSSAMFAMAAASGFDASDHDNGLNGTGGLLVKDVRLLREVARARGVEVPVSDRLVDAALTKRKEF